MKPMNVLITGSRGQLAGEFIRRLAGPRYRVEAPPEEELDITRSDRVEEAFRRHQPHMVINCAAYNLVDRAEQDHETAFRVNALGVKHLAEACRISGSLLIHYSTDYVFDGTKDAFYTEEDEPNPINRYGQTKLAGDRFVMETLPGYLLFRVSWVFGTGTQNFLHKLMDLAGKNRVLRVVSDQLSIPTPTDLIVQLTLRAVRKGLRGLYNLTAGGYVTRYELARYFLAAVGKQNLILPVTSDYFPSPARRPAFSALSNGKLAGALGVTIPSWERGIDRYVRTLAPTPI